ncbi:MAG: DUF1559 domain-containing protein [Planctomycetes bacterium]|nr:DUF1559 domain-containing protein [Planctomycetota bacterium]
MNTRRLHKLRPQARRTRCVVCMLFYLFVVTTAGSNLFAQDASSVAKDTTMVQPFITETTFLVIKVDPKRLALPNLPDDVKSVFPGGVAGYGLWAQIVTNGFDRLRAMTEGQVTYATVGIPLSENEWSAFLFMRETSERSRKQLTDLVASVHETQSTTRDGVTVIMPDRDIDIEERLDSIVSSPREELAEAFDAVKDYPIQFLLLPPAYVRRTVTELMPQLPRQLGDGPSSLLTDGLVWAALGIDVADPRSELIVQSSSEKAAGDLAAYLPKMMLSAYDGLGGVKTGIPRNRFQALLPLIKPTVTGDRITIRFDDLKSMSEGLRLMASAPAVAVEQVRRRRNGDKFKQILLGMHNYHDVYRSFPPRVDDRDADGRSGLSWRVHLLPLINERKLYKEFALDQPWDSPHNKRLIEKMPNVYESQWLGIKTGHTTFLAPAGEDTIFGGPKAVAFNNIIDGTSNTMTLVEVKPSLSVPWTAPKDYAFNPTLPAEGLRVGTDGRFLAALADGSVQMLRANIPAELFLRLFQMSDRKVIDWKEVR